MDDVISDHALVRWLERHHGLSLEEYRRELYDKVADRVLAGVSSVAVDGMVFVCKDKRLITVIPQGDSKNRERILRRDERAKGGGVPEGVYAGRPKDFFTRKGNTDSYHAAIRRRKK